MLGSSACVAVHSHVRSPQYHRVCLHAFPQAQNRMPHLVSLQKHFRIAVARLSPAWPRLLLASPLLLPSPCRSDALRHSYCCSVLSWSALFFYSSACLVLFSLSLWNVAEFSSPLWFWSVPHGDALDQLDYSNCFLKIQQWIRPMPFCPHSESGNARRDHGRSPPAGAMRVCSNQKVLQVRRLDINTVWSTGDSYLPFHASPGPPPWLPV